MTETEKIVVPCDSDCLEKIRDFIRKKAAQEGFKGVEVGRLVLAVDEASSNIVEHSYLFDSKHELMVTWNSGEDRAVIEIQDDSPTPFLPAMADLDMPAKIKYRHSGGYGKYLIPQLVDDLNYETIPGSHNKVSLIKYRQTPAENPDKNQGTWMANPNDIDRIRSLSLSNLLDLGMNLGRQEKAEDLINLFLKGTMGSIASQPVVLLTLNDDTRQYEIVGQTGLSKKIGWSHLTLPASGWTAEMIWTHKTPIVTERMERFRVPPEEREMLEKLHSAVLVPLFVGERLDGIVALGPKRTRHPFTDDDIRMVTVLGSLTVLLLKNKSREAVRFHKKETVGTPVAATLKAAIEETAKVIGNGFHVHLGEVDAKNIRVNLPADEMKTCFSRILLHIHHLLSEKSEITASVSGSKDGALLELRYQGTPLSFEKDSEGYNHMIDRLVSGGFKLADCPRWIQDEGGSLQVHANPASAGDTRQVTLRMELPLEKLKGKLTEKSKQRKHEQKEAV